ncbi:MAG TPA: zinc ribbon domain-containing protein [Gemmatimonadales bacterium]|nr:zinc ribbon domain-containing protein [Gemmatimonadales bacterium]
MPDELDRLFELLVRALAKDARLAIPFAASEVYERLVPYRSNRSTLRVASHQDYEMTVLRLLAGERSYVHLDPDDVREGFQREVTAVNPETGLFRNFPDSRVLVNRMAAERFLRGQAAFAPPVEASAEAEDESEPISWTSENPIPPVSLSPLPSPHSEPTFELADTEAHAPNQCPYCGGSLPTSRKVNFCPHCGQPPSGELKCPACGSEVDVGWAYCIGCGRATGFE